MGSACSAETQQAEKALEDTVEQAKEIKQAVQEKVGDAVDKVGEAAEQAKEVVQDAAEKAVEAVGAEKQVEQMKEAVADIAEKAAEVVADAKETVAEVAADVKEKVAEVVADVKEGAAAVAETVDDTMIAAREAVMGVMIVEFVVDKKGTTKNVDFKTQALGFSCARSKKGCCSTPKPLVVVGKVEKDQQAAKLGVQRGWVVKAVGGTDVEGLEQANKLLAEGAAELEKS
jgi:predicted phage tail protein